MSHKIPEKRETPRSITSFTSQILDSIFGHASYRHKEALRLVCKQWKTAVDANPYLWTRVNVRISTSDGVDMERPPIEFVEGLVKKSADLMIRVCVVVSELDDEGGDATTNVHASKKAQGELTRYLGGVISILTAHIHRWRKFKLHFIPGGQISSSIPEIVSRIPLSRASNLHSVSITSDSITPGVIPGDNQSLLFSIVANAPSSVRRLVWRGNTPIIEFLKYPNWELLTHVVLRDILALGDFAKVLKRCKNVKTMQLRLDSVHSGFAEPKEVNLPNLDGLTIEAGCEVFQMLETCIKAPKLGVLVVAIPDVVPMDAWPDVPTGGMTIRHTWSLLISFLERCPTLKVLQLHDPHGALPVDMIVDLMYSVQSALAVFVVVPGEEWIARPEVEDDFWKRLKEVKHRREDGVVVSKLKDSEGKDWMSFGWYVEPEAETFLRSTAYVKDTSFRWDILE